MRQSLLEGDEMPEKQSGTANETVNSYSLFIGRASGLGSELGMQACIAGSVREIDETAIANAPVWPAHAILDGVERRLIEIDRQDPTLVDRAALLGPELGGTVVLQTVEAK
jgi:hypothetical protein